jgi:Domain of unknown function (DUF6894)
MRLFFDVHKQQSSTYDYHGRDFGSPEDAALLAELIAADLGVSDTDDWVGARVLVRNADGEMLFSVPVQAAA